MNVVVLVAVDDTAARRGAAPVVVVSWYVVFAELSRARYPVAPTMTTTGAVVGREDRKK